MATTTRLVGAVTLLSFGTSGCSWLFMSRAPDPVLAPNYPVECTSSRAAPVIDSVFAGLYAVQGVAFAATDTCDTAGFDETCVEPEAKTAFVATSLALAGILAASAVSGYRTAGRCGQVKSLNALCITGDLSACQALRPGWAPSGWGPAQPPADPWGAPQAPRPQPPPPQPSPGGTQ